MSFGSLRTWTTRDGTLGLRTSLLNFFESLPLAARGGGSEKTTTTQIQSAGTEGGGSS